MSISSYPTLPDNENRPPAKVAREKEFAGDTERRTAAYLNVREDLSTGSTSKSLSVVEFRSRSTTWSQKVTIVILSESSVLITNLQEAFEKQFSIVPKALNSYSCEGQGLKITLKSYTTKELEQTTLEQLYPKIDLLIIDRLGKIDYPPHRVKAIINLTNKAVAEGEFFIKLPVRVLDLLEIIKILNIGAGFAMAFFCSINNEWIYDEQKRGLFGNNINIRFTEKENEVFRYLLTKEQYKAHKDELLKTIWQYHTDSNSNTIETNLYRLKNKLPKALLQVKDHSYKLMITKLV